MPIFTTAGRVSIAEALKLRPVHVAWGLGDGAWMTAPAENIANTALVNEVGRRLADSVDYVVPDVAGAIVMPSGQRYTITGTKTNRILVQCVFAFSDASAAVIREIGIFVGGTTTGAGPYFTGGGVVTPGLMAQYENVAPIYRSPTVGPSVQTVITF